MKKAVIYARYSSHSQRDESIDAQLRECHNYATKNDYIILEEYCDKALTGKNDNRAAFQKMIRDAKNNKFNYAKRPSLSFELYIGYYRLLEGRYAHGE